MGIRYDTIKTSPGGRSATELSAVRENRAMREDPRAAGEWLIGSAFLEHSGSQDWQSLCGRNNMTPKLLNCYQAGKTEPAGADLSRIWDHWLQIRGFGQDFRLLVGSRALKRKLPGLGQDLFRL